MASRTSGEETCHLLGNHEWYCYSRRLVVEEELAAARPVASELGVHFLWDDEIIVEGVRFLGSSLWTDYALHGEIADSMAYAKFRMNDHRLIYPRTDMKPLEPAEARHWHLKSRSWLTEKLSQVFPGKTVVVTHHLPHPRSIGAQYKGDHLNPAYCSDLAELVECFGAALWVHGHTHTSSDYVAGTTRVVCNPKGYGPRSRHARFENEAFDDRLVIEI